MAEQVTAAPAVDRGSLRLALIVGGLVLALVAGFGLGRLPLNGTAPSNDGRLATLASPDHTHPPGTAPHDHSEGGTGSGGADAGGLSLSAAGYTLVPERTMLPAGVDQPFRFQIRDVDGKPVTGYAVVHDKPMHMIVVRRDLSGYQHLHPSMDVDGTWSVPLTLASAGIWRAYADFSALDRAGRPSAVTLGVDLVVAGDYAPRALPPAAREATVDGFTVTYQGTPQVGAIQPLHFRVFADGQPVTELEPYLGAYGHLVALRSGDLGYLHVHPEEQLSDGAVKFWLTVPSAGSYRFFLDFQVAGVVRTAEFTLIVP